MGVSGGSVFERSTEVGPVVRRVFDGLERRLAPIVGAFPLVDRELTRVSADKRIFVLRAGITAIFLLLALSSGLNSLTTESEAQSWGQAVIGFVALVHVSLALGAAPIMSASLIAEEKRERTLPLLLMADFRGWDIFLAKFLSVFGVCTLLILSTSPLLAIAATVGGVELGGIIALTCVSVTLTAHSCAVGLWASARARGPREAMMITLAFLSCWHAALVYLEVDFTAPGFTTFALSPLVKLMDFVNSGSAPAGSFATVLLHAAFAVFAAWRTIRAVPKLAHEEEAVKRRKRRRVPSRVTRWWRGHPLVQLIAATTSGFTLSFDSWALRLIAAAGLAVIAGITYGYGIIFIALLFCYDIAACMMSIRRSGALDDILVTPVNQHRVARAFMRVFAGRAIVYLPALLVSLYFAWEMFRFSFSIGIAAAVIALLLPSQLFLIIAAGSYAGTRTNRAASQAALTILLVALTLILATGISHSIAVSLWTTPWRGMFTGAQAEMNTVIVASLLNVASGIACYIAFATQLREDLISHLRPRFQSFFDAFTE